MSQTANLMDIANGRVSIMFRRVHIEMHIAEENVVMQFTGLKDKNGKEIWEGDVLKGKNLEGFEEKAEVKWDYVQWYPLAGHRAFDECEVIGNIYESPELLTSKET